MNFVLTDYLPALPEMLVLAMASTILIVDLFLPPRLRAVSYFLSQATLLGAAVLVLWTLTAAPVYAFHDMFVADALAATLKCAVLVVTLFGFAYARYYLVDRGLFRGEYFVLGLFGVLGMMVLISARHFLPLYLGLELLSLSLYGMIAFQRDSTQATEAAMKYFVLGAIASGLLLYGLSMLYGATGTLDIAELRATLVTRDPNDIILVFGLVFVIVGVAFKLGAVPFHMWVPDVYHGAPTAVTIYIGTAPKIAGAALVLRLLVGGLEPLADSWQDMLVILALLSMALGNIVAIAQDNIKRMLAYSSISHMGFFLLGILSASREGYGASVFYVIAYAVMSLGAFGMIALLSRAGFEAEKLTDFRGLNQRSPWHAFLMLVLMFSMAGVPPTAGFQAKLLVVQAVVGTQQLWLAVAAVLFAVVGAFYYLRVVKLMYFDEPTETADVGGGGTIRGLLAVNALALIALVPWFGPAIDLCRRVVSSLA